MALQVILQARLVELDELSTMRKGRRIAATQERVHGRRLGDSERIWRCHSTDGSAAEGSSRNIFGSSGRGSRAESAGAESIRAKTRRRPSGPMSGRQTSLRALDGIDRCCFFIVSSTGS